MPIHEGFVICSLFVVVVLHIEQGNHLKITLVDDPRALMKSRNFLPCQIPDQRSCGCFVTYEKQCHQIPTLYLNIVFQQEDQGSFGDEAEFRAHAGNGQNRSV